MEYNVFVFDFCTNEIKVFNVFNSIRFSESLAQIKKKKCYSKEELRKALLNAFWSKYEYEIDVRGHDNEGSEFARIDVYDQVIINFDLFEKYVRQNYFKIKGE